VHVLLPVIFLASLLILVIFSAQAQINQ
jgi:hypothetical protein